MQEDMTYQKQEDINTIKNKFSNKNEGKVAYADIINPETGELFVEAGEVISKDIAEEIQNSGINVVEVKVDEKPIKIIGNGTVNIHDFDNKCRYFRLTLQRNGKL